jgi:hypothetical protein
MNENVHTINNMDIYTINQVSWPLDWYEYTVVDGGIREVHSDSEVV